MPRAPAPKRHPVKVYSGTYGDLLRLARRRNIQDHDDLADSLLAGAIAQANTNDDRQDNEDHYLAAKREAEFKGRPTPLRRDFGL